VFSIESCGSLVESDSCALSPELKGIGTNCLLMVERRGRYAAAVGALMTRGDRLVQIQKIAIGSN